MPGNTIQTITKFLYSPPGVMLASGILFYGVQKFFKEIEEKLTDHTKLEIAVWLLDRKPLTPAFQNWPDTFCKVFDRTFGKNHVSWTCFWRSAVASYAGVFIVATYIDRSQGWPIFSYDGIIDLVETGFWSNVLPDFISLIETRYVLGLMRRTNSGIVQLALIALDFVLTSSIALLTAHVVLSVIWFDSPFSWKWSLSAILGHPTDFHENHRWLSIIIPAFLTSIWLWLYALSGFLLRGAYKFDMGFKLFNSKLDIEKKPLQSIGIVSATLLTGMYLGWVILSAAFGLLRP